MEHDKKSKKRKHEYGEEEEDDNDEEVLMWLPSFSACLRALFCNLFSFFLSGPQTQEEKNRQKCNRRKEIQKG